MRNSGYIWVKVFIKAFGFSYKNQMKLCSVCGVEGKHFQNKRLISNPHIEPPT